MKNKGKWLPPLLAALAALLMCGMACRYSTQLTNEDFIRFHVVANSDSEEDQALKLKVRDELLKEINGGLVRRAVGQAEAGDKTASLDIDESRRYIIENITEIEAAAERIVRAEGYDYDVRAEFGVSWIPEKTYGSVTFPAGNYEALKVLIGKAEGHNWWCVLYPPLCLIDTKNAPGASEDIMKDAVLSGKYRELAEAAESGRPAKVLHLRFKSLETVKKITVGRKE